MRYAMYGTGSALLFVADSVTLVVDDRSRKVDTEAVWEASQKASTVLELIDALGGGSLVNLPAFAAVISHDDTCSAIVRGDFQITIEQPQSHAGPASWSGVDVSTWAEQTFSRREVEAFNIQRISEDNLDSEMLPIEVGVVRASEVKVQYLSKPSKEAAPRAKESESVTKVTPPPTIDVPVGPPMVREDVPVGPPSFLEGVPASPPTVREDVSVGPPRGVELDTALDNSDALLDPHATIVDAADMAFDAMFGMTVVGRRPEDAAIRKDLDEVELDEVDKEAEDHTVARPKMQAVNELASDFPSPLPKAPSRVTQEPVVRLRLSNGKEVIVDGPTLIGRAPQARNVSGAEVPQIVIVDDPYVSSTHLELDVADGKLVAVDRSSNGTLLTVDGHSEAQMKKGTKVLLADAANLKISENVNIQVMIE